MDTSYKFRKQAFVSNLTGGSISEITAVTLVAPVSILLWSVLQSRLSFFTPYSAPALVADFLLNVLTVLFANTILSSWPWTLNILLASLVLLLLFYPTPPGSQLKAKSSARSSAAEGTPARHTFDSYKTFPIHPFLTNYRAALMIITCVDILAVDFCVFPRRFAKVETWGTSLMDLGVGSFVFSSGIVSARSLLKKRNIRSKKVTSWQRLIMSMRHSIPLFALGLIRLCSVKGLDYVEHVTEYGMHWNFFFTLSLLPPIVELFDALVTVIPSYEMLSIGIAILYQVILESTNLKTYILLSPRGPDLLSKNKEGIFSFLGYLAIFLSGRAIGARVTLCVISLSVSPQQTRKRVLLNLAGQALAWTGLFILHSTWATAYGGSSAVSRRLANLPYVLWVAAFNNAQLFICCLFETIFFPSVHQALGKEDEGELATLATSPIMAAFNRKGLPVFLVGNILTGTINMSIQTLDVSTIQAGGILIVYAAFLTGVALALEKNNIKLRL